MRGKIKWGHALSAIARWAFTGVLSRAQHPKGNGTARHGLAPNMSSNLKPDGLRNIDLTARAMTLHNRDRKAAQAYIDRHRILAKGRCFDAP